MERLASRNQTIVSKEEGINLAKEIGCIAFCENSALTKEGLNETFEMALKSYFLGNWVFLV